MSKPLPLPENLLTLHEAALNPANAALMQPIHEMLTADAVLGVARLEVKELPVRSVSEWLRLGASPALEDVRQMYGWVAMTPIGSSGEVLTERLYSLGESAANAMGETMHGKCAPEAGIKKGRTGLQHSEIANFYRISTEDGIKKVLDRLQSSDANATASMVLGHVAKFYAQATGALAGAGCPPFAAGCMAAGLMANRNTRSASLLMVEPLAAMSFLPSPPLMGGKDGAWMGDWCNAIEKPDSAQAQEWINALASKRSSAVLGTLGSLGFSADSIAKQLDGVVLQNGAIASQVAGRIYIDRQSVARGANVSSNTAAKALEYLCNSSTVEGYLMRSRGTGGAAASLHGGSASYYQPSALELLVDKPKIKMTDAINRAVRGPECVAVRDSLKSRAPLLPSDGPRARKLV